ncbi:MAG TPA: TadE/TadG family type IV pilus assembly protein [Terriglobales bacterium]|nr:TadE/TadG family type IV pilus assembly protein [Terriglobales bacterium]
MRRLQARHRERGTQIVEMAVALPLLLFMALVVIEGAGMVRTHQVLNNAAREAAHLSTFQWNKDTPNFSATPALKNQAVAYAAANGVTITAADVTINQCVIQTTPGGANSWASRVAVQTNYQFRYLPNIPFMGAPVSVPIAGRAEFINFYGC